MHLSLLKQVVNGFFWAGKPVVSQVKESTRSTALGVSTCHHCNTLSFYSMADILDSVICTS